MSPSSPTSIDDRRTSIDVVIIRESLKALQGHIRWLPTDRMIADGLTKDKIDPADLLRSCIRAGKYQISPEATVLARQAADVNFEPAENVRNSRTELEKPRFTEFIFIYRNQHGHFVFVYRPQYVLTSSRWFLIVI